MLKKLLLLTSLLTLTSFADTFPGLSPSSDIIKNLYQTTCQIKRHSPLPGLFLTQIPPTKNPQKLYASYSSYGANPDFNKYWQINFDTMPDCQGMHICSMGVVSAEKDGTLETSYQPNMQSKPIPKKTVVLKNHLTAYYTPFHTLGDSFNPSLEWVDEQVLYRIEWRLDPKLDAEKVLVNMANTAIKVTRASPNDKPPLPLPESNAAE